MAHKIHQMTKPMNVMGRDNREVVQNIENPPEKYIAKIISNKNFGTAYAITSQYFITAKHVVSEEINYKLQKGLHHGCGDAMPEEADGTSYKIDKIILHPNEDIALVKIEEKLNNKEFLFPNPFNQSNHLSKEFRLSGYSLGFQKNDEIIPCENTIFTSRFKIMKNADNDEYYYTTDTLDGTSGSPLSLSESREIVGLHTDGSQQKNWGILFDEQDIQWIRKIIN